MPIENHCLKQFRHLPALFWNENGPGNRSGHSKWTSGLPGNFYPSTQSGNGVIANWNLARRRRGPVVGRPGVCELSQSGGNAPRLHRRCPANASSLSPVADTAMSDHATGKNEPTPAGDRGIPTEAARRDDERAVMMGAVGEE